MTSVLIIEARYYEDIADELMRGALSELEERGVAHERVTVPGALEIPVALSLAIRAGQVGSNARHKGCVALGCVIRGETSHYDIVAGESARALLDIGIAHSVPVGNGILTVDNRNQAWARARTDDRNKGRDAVRACLSLIDLQSSLGAPEKK
ncbi:MAG: 6,7-dimethyl-8-ribityllumazine synthase [Methyloligellaceae bacterium]